MKRLRILYISQYFPPEVGATQTRAFEMASNLVQHGHQVTVLTEFPNHPKGIISPEYRGKLVVHEKYRGMHIYRTWVFTCPEKTFVTRMGFYLSFMAADRPAIIHARKTNRAMAICNCRILFTYYRDSLQSSKTFIERTD